MQKFIIIIISHNLKIVFCAYEKCGSCILQELLPTRINLFLNKISSLRVPISKTLDFSFCTHIAFLKFNICTHIQNCTKLQWNTLTLKNKITVRLLLRTRSSKYIAGQQNTYDRLNIHSFENISNEMGTTIIASFKCGCGKRLLMPNFYLQT